MKTKGQTSFGARLIAAVAAALAVLFLAAPALAQMAQPVKVTETSEVFTMDNGIIQAVVSKRSGDLVSMKYKGVETLSEDAGGHSAVYWSHDVTGGVETISRVSVNPSTNGGERAEVSVKGISGGRKMGHGPGTAADGDIQLDIDLRYSLGRGETGVYTYTAFEHKPEYGTGTMAEARIAVELAKYFDDIHVDDLRSGRYPLIGAGADKYMYVTRQADERVSGWTSSTKKIGWFQLNPSAEYLSGGPNKAEFTAHGEPTVLNYWKSSHYGGANVTVREGERWVRVVGPFLFYVNEGASHQAMLADARAQLKKEEAKWPYGWVDAEGYAKPATRGTVTGQLALNDPLAPNGGRFGGKVMVGLAQTPYTLTSAAGVARTIEWQNDGKFLQFWTRNDNPDGRFTVPKVAPGKYTLYAYADGVLGEFRKTDVVVPAGGNVDLGRLVWTPVRAGKMVWEIGKADRDAREFRDSESYFLPAIQLRLGQTFPDGITYRVGQSDTRKDWFFAHVPTETPQSKPVIRPIEGVSGIGKPTPYRIVFNMPAAAKGAATLQIARVSNSAAGVEVSVNGTPVGLIRSAPTDNSIARHQIYGHYAEASLAFDASLLKAGENIMVLTVPAASLNAGIIYDYLRLDLDEAAATPAKPTEIAFPAPRAPGPTPTAAAGGGAAGAAAATPSQVVTIHDDARFGLPDVARGSARFTARDNAVFVQTGSAAPRQLAKADRLGPWAVSPDGKLLAYATVEGDAANALNTIRVVDAATGAAVAEEVKWARYTGVAWSADSKGFYYSGVNPPANPAATTVGGQQTVFYHALGTPRASDRRILWSDRPGMVHFAEITEDGRWLVINGSVRADGKSEINLIDLTEPVRAPYKAMRRMQERWQLAGSRGQTLYFVTDFGAERGRLVALDTSKTTLPITEVVPQATEKLQAARLKDGKFALSYAGASAPVIRTVALPTAMAAR